jgi:hypothetical protein
MVTIISNKFTILLPIYQRDDLFLNFTNVIESIYKNSVLPDDLIVLVDGDLKTDFKQLIKKQQKKYNFRILKSKKVGLAKILNKGIQQVRTNWIARMDGDDLCDRNRFKNSLKFMNKNFDLFGGQVKEFDCNIKKFFIKKVPCKSADIIKTIKYRNPFNHMTVFYKTKLAKKVGGYPDLYLKEDYGLWCKFIKIGARVGNMNKIVVKVSTDGMHKRRSGIKYMISEIKLQKILLEFGLTNFFSSICICALRILVHALPNTIKKLIYINFLRSKL